LFAAHVIVLGQVITASLLFPFLLRDRRAAVAVIASAWPFVALGGMLSALPAGRMAVAAAYVSLWLAALAAVRRALPRRFHPAAVAAASLIVIGMPLLFYLSVEFGDADFTADRSKQYFDNLTPFSPPLGALLHLSKPSNWHPWMLPSALLAVSLAWLFRAHKTRQVIHNL
jgi:hypothetical protein